MKKRAAKKKAEFDAMQEERRLAKELTFRKGLMAKPEAEAPADVVWSGLVAWKEVIAAEQKESGGGKSKTKQDMENKARASVLNKVHNGVTAKIMVTLTEISSKLMTMTEDQIREADNEIGAVVNALNGVIMTYHMGAWPGVYHCTRSSLAKNRSLALPLLRSCDLNPGAVPPLIPLQATRSATCISDGTRLTS